MEHDGRGGHHAFDPELVVFGGGAMGAAGCILPFVQQHNDRYTWTPWGKVKAVAAALGNDASALGVPTLFDVRGENSL